MHVPCSIKNLTTLFYILLRNTRHERLEVDASKASTVDIANIVKDSKTSTVPPLGTTWGQRKPVQGRPNSADFVDDPDVPPLE